MAALSAHGDTFSAGAPYYGICDGNFFPLKNIKAPVLGHYGEKDELKGRHIIFPYYKRLILY